MIPEITTFLPTTRSASCSIFTVAFQERCFILPALTLWLWEVRSLWKFSTRHGNVLHCYSGQYYPWLPNYLWRRGTNLAFVSRKRIERVFKSVNRLACIFYKYLTAIFLFNKCTNFIIYREPKRILFCLSAIWVKICVTRERSK